MKLKTILLMLLLIKPALAADTQLTPVPKGPREFPVLSWDQYQQLAKRKPKDLEKYINQAEVEMVTAAAQDAAISPEARAELFPQCFVSRARLLSILVQHHKLPPDQKAQLNQSKGPPNPEFNYGYQRLNPRYKQKKVKP